MTKEDNFVNKVIYVVTILFTSVRHLCHTNSAYANPIVDYTEVHTDDSSDMDNSLANSPVPTAEVLTVSSEMDTYFTTPPVATD